jgi:hypothetical protein
VANVLHVLKNLFQLLQLVGFLRVLESLEHLVHLWKGEGAVSCLFTDLLDVEGGLEVFVHLPQNREADSLGVLVVGDDNRCDSVGQDADEASGLNVGQVNHRGFAWDTPVAGGPGAEEDGLLGEGALVPTDEGEVEGGGEEEGQVVFPVEHHVHGDESHEE